MRIRKYNKTTDEAAVMQMIADEDGWDYANADMYENYTQALEMSITYIAIIDEQVCGYSRSIDDCGFYIYVCDLLVKPEFRGNGIGKKLMEYIYGDYPTYTIYVMSGVDEYYEKTGYKREGSIYEVANPQLN